MVYSAEAESLQLFRTCAFIVAIVICVVGSTVSVFSACVYLKLPLPNATNIFLTVLCFADLLHLTFGLSKSSFNLCELYLEDISPNTQFVFNYAHIMVLALFRNFSIGLHCIVCAERFVAVVFPIKVKLIRLFRHPKMCLILLGVIDLIYIVPFCVRLNNASPQERDSMTSLPRVNYSKFYKDNINTFRTYEIIANAIAVYIPFILTIMFTIFTAITIRNSWQCEGSGVPCSWATACHVKQRRQVTRIVVASSFMFVALAFPTNIVKLLSSIMTKSFSRPGSQRNIYITCTLIGFLCDLVGNTVNFFFYYNMSRSFRQTFKATVCKCFAYRKDAVQKMRNMCEGFTISERNI